LTRACCSRIGPDTTGYYDLQFGGGSEAKWTADRIARWEVQIDRWATAPVPDETAFVELSTNEPQVEFSEGVATFTGTIVNDGSQNLQAALVVVGLRRRDSGALVGLGSLGLNEPLATGGQTAYSLFIYYDPVVNDGNLDAFVQVAGRAQVE
jgi:hypothetical protein